MAKARGRKLKVFEAQFGFSETVIAAPSRAVALRIWGTHQDLFKSGQARESTNTAAIAAALAHPETSLQRAVGSNDPFGVEPSHLPKVPDAPAKAKKSTAKIAPAERRLSPPPDRSKLDAAETALRALNEERKAEEAELRQEEEKLTGPFSGRGRPDGE